MRRTLLVLWASALMVVLMGASALPAFADGGGDRRDYTTIHNFNVEIDGVIIGGFKEVDGLESKTEITE